MASSNKTIAKNTAFLYVRMLVVMAVTLYTTRVVLQVLGASDYGIYNVVGGIGSLMVFINGALSSSSSRFLTYELGTGDKDRLDSTFSASLNLHLTAAVLVLIISETVGQWFLLEKMVIPPERITAAIWVFQFSIVTMMLSFTQVPFNASLIAHENMSIYAYIGLYEAITNLLIVYLISVSSFDKLILYALALMLNKAVIQFFMCFYTFKKYDECRFRIVKDSVLYKKLLGYSGWDLYGNFAAVCQGEGINIVLNLFFGPVVNAARAVAVQIQGGVLSFVNNFLLAVRPQVVKSFAEGNTQRMYQLTFMGTKFAYMLTLALVLPICFEIHFVLKIWLGNDIPEDTEVFAILVLITYLMETYHMSSLMAYHAIGRIRTGNLVGGSMMIMALPISYVFLKLGLPAYSVYIAIFIVNFIQMFYTWWLIHRYVAYSYRELLKKVYIPTVAITILSLIPSSIVHMLMNDGWIRFLTHLIVTEVSLFFLVFIIGLSKSEREKVIIFVNNKIKKHEKTYH
jgi:O-antigen/teichoic acid export membrane protein